jgi:large subunit ribosomal protein L13
MKTLLLKKEEVQPNWYVVDATGQVLGRLAVRIANALRGRNKPNYTPHVDNGDFVVVINAEKIALTGKKEVQNEYMFYNGYVGRERHRSLADMRTRHPEFILEHAVRGMLPKNRIARRMFTKLKVYAGPEHPHVAQDPKPLPL